MEKEIKLTARLYEMRDTARTLLGDNYAGTMSEIGKYIEYQMDIYGASALSVATKISKDATPMDVLKIMGAVVEMMDPSEQKGE